MIDEYPINHPVVQVMCNLTGIANEMRILINNAPSSVRLYAPGYISEIELFVRKIDGEQEKLRALVFTKNIGAGNEH